MAHIVCIFMGDVRPGCEQVFQRDTGFSHSCHISCLPETEKRNVTSFKCGRHVRMYTTNSFLALSPVLQIRNCQ